MSAQLQVLRHLVQNQLFDRERRTAEHTTLTGLGNHGSGTTRANPTPAEYYDATGALTRPDLVLLWTLSDTSNEPGM